MLHKFCIDGNCEALVAYLSALKEQETVDRVAFLVNQRNGEKYSPLHVAIFHRNIGAMKVLVEFGADVNAKCHGMTTLHLVARTAAQPLPESVEPQTPSAFGLQALMLLLAAGANPLSKDDNGHTILHLAASYNLVELLDVLASQGYLERLVGLSPRISGLTALHLAAAVDSLEVAQRLLACSTCPVRATLRFCKSNALHVAATNKSMRVFSLLVKQHPNLLAEKNIRGENPTEILERDGFAFSQSSSFSPLSSSSSSSSQTLVVSSPLCFRHHTCAPSQLRDSPWLAPPENVRRLHLLLDRSDGVLRAADICNRLRWVTDTEMAPISDVLRVHEWDYICQLRHHCERLALEQEEDEALFNLDADTSISRDSFQAALAAAGAVCRAVDEVLKRSAKNAFCAVRPPGHHAGPRGLVKSQSGADSHGFCLLNNISIAAAYAMNRHRDVVRKVAIVDFDVHHGNGTEETVRWLRPRVETVDVTSGFVFGQLQTAAYKPWFSHLDADRVLFVSVHGYGPREKGLEYLFPQAAFYPGTGPTSIPPITRLTSHKEQSQSEENAVAKPVTAEEGLEQKEPQEQTENNEVSQCLDEENGEVIMEDEDDDEDGDYEEDEDDDEDESWHEEAVPAEQSSSTAPASQIQELRDMYSRPHCPKGHKDVTVAKDAACLGQMEPLILDIGVHLPKDDVGGATEVGVTSEWPPSPLSRGLEEFSYRMQWRNYFREEIFPRLLLFQPDLILVSAGFDAHKRDTINGGYISLVDEDFAWVTSKLAQVAETCCEGRLVSVLEGGYQLGGEFGSAFARSVHDHVQALTTASLGRAKYDAAAVKQEQAEEAKLLNELKAQRREEVLQQQQQLVLQQSAVMKGALVEEEGEPKGRKRQRNPVDYAALDQELRRAAAEQK
eukprot:gene4697-5145_t